MKEYKSAFGGKAGVEDVTRSCGEERFMDMPLRLDLFHLKALMTLRWALREVSRTKI